MNMFILKCHKCERWKQRADNAVRIGTYFGPFYPNRQVSEHCTQQSLSLLKIQLVKDSTLN